MIKAEVGKIYLFENERGIAYGICVQSDEEIYKMRILGKNKHIGWVGDDEKNHYWNLFYHDKQDPQGKIIKEITYDEIPNEIFVELI